MIVFGAVGTVAAGAVQRYVGVPWILHLFSDGMGGMPLIFMTIGTDLDISLKAEKVWVVGTVRGVAGAAVPFQHRIVLDLRLLLSGHNTGVTASAKVQRSFGQKVRLFRGMGIVTRQAPLLFQDWPVGVSAFEGFLHRLPVTLTARLDAPSGRRCCTGSRFALVALAAHPLCNRTVNVILENRGLVGPVWIVAQGAG